MSEEQQDWYNNKQLTDIVIGLRNDFQAFNEKLTRVITMLRDYNGLHEKQDDLELRIQKLETERKTKIRLVTTVVGWTLGGAALIFEGAKLFMSVAGG